jgi:YVTN family beta-propeller protein
VAATMDHNQRDKGHVYIASNTTSGMVTVVDAGTNSVVAVVGRCASTGDWDTDVAEVDVIVDVTAMLAGRRMTKYVGRGRVHDET